jgi:hypothetical protein
LSERSQLAAQDDHPDLLLPEPVDRVDGRDDRQRRMRDVDPIGQALAVAFLFSVVFVLIQGREMGGSGAP